MSNIFLKEVQKWDVQIRALWIIKLTHSDTKKFQKMNDYFCD